MTVPVLDALDRVADFVDECAPSLLDPEQILADRDALRELRLALAARPAFVCVYPGNDGDWWRIVSPGADPCTNPKCVGCRLARLLSGSP